MKCKVISLIKVKQGNHLPYFIVRAIGIENEEDAEYLDEDDYWNSCHHYRNSKKNFFLLLNRKSKRWKICIQQIVEEMLLVMVHLLD